jgi:hypothetical protein
MTAHKPTKRVAIKVDIRAAGDSNYGGNGHSRL